MIELIIFLNQILLWIRLDLVGVLQDLESLIFRKVKQIETRFFRVLLY